MSMASMTAKEKHFTQGNLSGNLGGNLGGGG